MPNARQPNPEFGCSDNCYSKNSATFPCGKLIHYYVGHMEKCKHFVPVGSPERFLITRDDQQTATLHMYM